MKNTSAKLIVENVQSEFESFFKPSEKTEHGKVLEEVLNSLETIDFRQKAGIESNENLPQKHLVVMCVDALLAKVKEKNFDLTRKNDFIFAFNGEYWKELDREIIKDFLGQVAEKFSVNSLEARHYEFKDKLYKQFISSTYFKAVEAKTNTVLINLQNGTFEVSAKGYSLRQFSAADFLTY